MSFNDVSFTDSFAPAATAAAAAAAASNDVVMANKHLGVKRGNSLVEVETKQVAEVAKQTFTAKEEGDEKAPKRQKLCLSFNVDIGQPKEPLVIQAASLHVRNIKELPLAENIEFTIKNFKLLAKQKDFSGFSTCLRDIHYDFPYVGKSITSLGVFTPKGMRKLIGHLQFKGQIKNTVACIVCDDFRDFKTALAKVGRSPNQRFCLAVRHCYDGGKRVSNEHVTPVFIETVQQKESIAFRIVITDSVGKSTEVNDYQNAVIEAIIEILKKPEIYTSIVQRQIDHTNCPIFTIADMAQFSKNDVLKFIKQNATIKPAKDYAEKGQSVFEFDLLPPGMMRHAQNISVIQAYADRVENASAQKILQQAEQYEDEVLRSSGAKIRMNRMINILFLKYAKLVTIKALTSEQQQ